MAHAITTKQGTTFSTTKAERTQKSNAFLSAFNSEKIEFNRFGISAAVLLFVVCFSSVAVGVGAMNSPLEVGIIVMPTMAVLVSVISVQNMKFVLGFAAISTLINLVITLMNIIM